MAKTYLDIQHKDRIRLLSEMMALRAKQIKELRKLLEIDHENALQVEWDLRCSMPPLYSS